MNESFVDPSIVRIEFTKIVEVWIVNSYKWLKDKEEIPSQFNLHNFIRNTLDNLVNEWTESLIPDLFDIFIQYTFKLKSEDEDPLYTLGEIYRAFSNVIPFQIQIKTIEFIKENLINWRCDYNWLDTPFLDNYYRSLSTSKEKRLRFSIRNLILLSLKYKSRRIKDIRI